MILFRRRLDFPHVIAFPVLADKQPFLLKGPGQTLRCSLRPPDLLRQHFLERNPVSEYYLLAGLDLKPLSGSPPYISFSEDYKKEGAERILRNLMRKTA